MKVVIFPEDGQPQGDAFLKKVPNDWHLIRLELKAQIEAKGWEFHVWPVTFDCKAPDVMGIYNGIPTTYHPPVIEKSILMLLEPPCVKPRVYDRLHGWHMTRILTSVKELVDDKRIFYNPFPCPSYTKDLSHIVRDKYICAITSGGKTFPGGLYEDRRQAYMGWGKDLDLYGWGWHNDKEMVEKVNYLGPVEDKVAKLAEYKYCLVFENFIVASYNSEKLYRASFCPASFNSAMPSGLSSLCRRNTSSTATSWATVPPLCLTILEAHICLHPSMVTAGYWASSSRAAASPSTSLASATNRVRSGRNSSHSS